MAHMAGRVKTAAEKQPTAFGYIVIQQADRPNRGNGRGFKIKHAVNAAGCTCCFADKKTPIPPEGGMGAMAPWGAGETGS